MRPQVVNLFPFRFSQTLPFHASIKVFRLGMKKTVLGFGKAYFYLRRQLVVFCPGDLHSHMARNHRRTNLLIDTVFLVVRNLFIRHSFRHNCLLHATRSVRFASFKLWLRCTRLKFCFYDPYVCLFTP